MEAAGTREGTVTVVGAGGVRSSLAALAGGKKEGILRASDDGITLALFGSKRFSTVFKSRSRKSAKVSFLGHIDNVVDFGLKDQESQDGSWFITMKNDEDKESTYNFRCSSIFEAVGWLQSIRKLCGRKELPIVVVLGETGSGKSALSSALSGLPKDNKVFKVDDSVKSATSKPAIYHTHWLGRDDFEEAFIMDTPGLSDTRGRDAEIMTDILKALASLGGVHSFLILFSAESPRLRGPLERMLGTFETAFGKQFWLNASIVFSRWYMDARSVKRRRKTPEKLSEQWNEALRERFPAITEMPRSDTALPCFFVDSLPNDTEERDIAEKELRKVSVIARENPEFDCSKILPDQDSVAALFPDGRIPPGAEELAELLRLNHLHEKLPKLISAGVVSLADLKSLRDRHLAQFFGWTEEEIGRLRGSSNPASPLSPNYVVVNDFRKLGLPIEKLLAGKYDAKAVLEMEDSELMELLGLNVMQLYKYFEWRSRLLKGHPCTLQTVYEGAVVSASTTNWPYHELEMSQAGNGPGIILNWRDAQGNVNGVTDPPQDWVSQPDAFDPPSKNGWARVFWFATGLSNTYRIGDAEESELQFEYGPDAGIDDVEAENPHKAKFTPTDFHGNATIHSHQLRCNFPYILGLKFPFWTLFDIRPEVCKALGGFEHGDIVEFNGGRALCIGVSYTGPKPELLYKVLNTGRSPTEEGAGAFAPGTPLRLVGKSPVDPVRYSDAEAFYRQDLDNDAMQDLVEIFNPNFEYPIGMRFPVPAKFDTTERAIHMFLPGAVCGDEFEMPGGRKLTLIGVARASESHELALWFHEEGHPGASSFSPLASVLHSRLKKTGNRRQVSARPLSDQAFKPPEASVLRSWTLKPTLEFPVGTGLTTRRLVFDVRDEVCKPLCGYSSGTVLSLEGTDTEVTVVGVAVDPETALPAIFLYMEGSSGAGIFDHFYNAHGAYKEKSTGRNLEALADQLLQREQGSSPVDRLRQLLENDADDAQTRQADDEFESFLESLDQE